MIQHTLLILIDFSIIHFFSEGEKNFLYFHYCGIYRFFNDPNFC